MSKALDVKIVTIYGVAPVQAEGTVNGHTFYFRSRGSHWSLNVSHEPGASCHSEDSWIYREDYAPWPDAGFIPEDEVRGKLAQGLTRWSEWKNQERVPCFAGRRSPI